MWGRGENQLRGCFPWEFEEGLKVLSAAASRPGTAAHLLNVRNHVLNFQDIIIVLWNSPVLFLNIPLCFRDTVGLEGRENFASYIFLLCGFFFFFLFGLGTSY